MSSCWRPGSVSPALWCCSNHFSGCSMPILGSLKVKLSVGELAHHVKRGHPFVKFIMAAVQERDVDPILYALRERKFGVTRFASHGSFWRWGSATLLIGVAEHQVEEVIDLLREQCHRCQELRAGCVAPGSRYETEVGGAGIFVLNIERFEQLWSV